MMVVTPCRSVTARSRGVPPECVTPRCVSPPSTGRAELALTVMGEVRPVSGRRKLVAGRELWRCSARLRSATPPRLPRVRSSE
jgi:hypothetical protein